MTESYYVAAEKDDNGCVVGSGLGFTRRVFNRNRRMEMGKHLRKGD